MHSYSFHAADEQATERLGRALAQVLPDSAVVALNGPLGAGKTRLVQAVAVASGVDRRDVSSPTFVLVHEYRGSRPIFHFDAYRLKDEDEFQALGPDEYFEAGGLTFVEWGDRVSRSLPLSYLEVRLEPASQTARDCQILAHGTGYGGVLKALTQRLG